MELQCGVCLLRPWRESDAAGIVRHANDRDVWLNLRDRFPHPYGTADAHAYIRSVVSQSPPLCSAEIGYWVGRTYWGRGIMTAAVRAVTTYAFTSLDLVRVFALPFTDNAASVRVLEKAGYMREGLLRSSAIKAGQVRDQYLYAAVRPGP